MRCYKNVLEIPLRANDVYRVIALRLTGVGAEAAEAAAAARRDPLLTHCNELDSWQLVCQRLGVMI